MIESFLYKTKYNKFILNLEIYTYENKICKIFFNYSKIKNFRKNIIVLSKPNSVIQKFIDKFNNYLCGEKENFEDIPFILFNCTDFELKVYNALKTIEFGCVISYKRLAQKINNPKAYRAVGNACSKNPLPLIFPCHRVIRKNGSIGGFTGGIEIKKLFLSLEKGDRDGLFSKIPR